MKLEILARLARGLQRCLRLPAPLEAEVEKLAKEDGVSLNPFVADKASASRTPGADLTALDRIMALKVGLRER